MAVNIEIIEYKNLMAQPGGRSQPIGVFPANKVTNVTAVGATTLQAGTRLVRIRNRTAGDSSVVLLRTVASGTNAAAGNAVQITAGNSYDFALPKGVDASLYGIDVRAG